MSKNPMDKQHASAIAVNEKDDLKEIFEDDFEEGSLLKNLVDRLTYSVNAKKLRTLSAILHSSDELGQQIIPFLKKLDDDYELTKKERREVNNFISKIREIESDDTVIHWNLLGVEITKYDQELFDKYLEEKK